MAGCEKSAHESPNAVSSVVPSTKQGASVPTFATELAGTLVDAARTKLDQKRPDEALPLLLSALRAYPASEEARALAETILRETSWNFPVLSIGHQNPVEQIAYAAPSLLWVSLGGQKNTTVLWNLETLKIDGTLFPVVGSTTKSLVFDELHHSMVVGRGDVNLLCNALTLKPVCDLGPTPDELTLSATVVFSQDGLLVAHAGYVSEKDHSVVWHLRDTASGQIIRTSAAVAKEAPQPLAAFLDRSQLRVLDTSGGLMEMPVSPVEEIRYTPIPEPVKLVQAQFSSDGNSILTLLDQGPHQSAVQSVISYSDEEDGSLELAALAERFTWSRQPNIWNGLMRTDAAHAPFSVDGNLLRILSKPHAPIQTGSPLTAVTFAGKEVMTGEENGTVEIHHLFPLPKEIAAELKPGTMGSKELVSLEKLTLALTGCRYDVISRKFSRIAAVDRPSALDGCDFEAIRTIFPSLDFHTIPDELKAIEQRNVSPESFQLLTDRLARADTTGAPDPQAVKLVEIFGDGDSNAVLAAINGSGESGPAAATALMLALKSEHPEWISASLATAKNLPPLLHQISISRIAWLEGRKADALATWPEIFPKLPDVRAREDWDGWEQADFQSALDNIQECVRAELDSITVAENSTPEQRKAVAEKLNDPLTVAAVGRPRYADACLKAALAFSAHKEDAEATFQLATIARNLGAPPEPCLRAEALALTALGDYQQAHPRWIELITEHPVATHLPGDYAEAAYTAFENMDPRQAMEILTTGMHRFPHDANFAIRAGWVALLTGNSERAYRFLREGQRIGFPEEKIENATALLVIAAAQTGANDDAGVYYQDLLKIDQAWGDPAILDTLDWPEELESTLRLFTH